MNLRVIPVHLLLALCSAACSSPARAREARLVASNAVAAGTAAPTSDDSEASRRGLPAPFPSPPFPSSEYLGVPTIGVADTEQYALDRVSHEHGGALGDWLHENRIKVYGWVDVSANLSSSKDSNLPDAFAIRPNRALELQQTLLRFERIPDTVQREHIDWGFRFDQLYGLDYRYTTAKGIFSDQLIEDDQTYGYDPVMFYGEVYLPHVGEGTILKFGRFILLPGIEAEVSPYNYMFSHTLLYTYFPYTHMGVVSTTRVDDNWTVQLGLTVGSDVAAWEDEAELTPITGLRWVSPSNDDSLFLCTITNSGDFSYNNVNMVDAVWTHRFGARVHTLTESYYAWQDDVPGFGAVNSHGASNYLVGAVNEQGYWAFRNEVFNDDDGQRTGFDTVYTTHTLGYVYKPFEWLYLRPELRYSHSYDQDAYDDGNAGDQWALAADAIFRF